MDSTDEFLAEMGWLLVWSKCRFTDVNMRTDWIVRKQRVLHALKNNGIEVKDYRE